MDVFKDEILRKIEESLDYYYQKYPDIITLLQINEYPIMKEKWRIVS